MMDVVGHFTEGRDAYRAGNWDQATKSFETCLSMHPDDALSKTYLGRIEQLSAAPPDDWKGVWVMTTK